MNHLSNNTQKAPIVSSQPCTLDQQSINVYNDSITNYNDDDDDDDIIPQDNEYYYIV